MTVHPATPTPPPTWQEATARLPVLLGAIARMHRPQMWARDPWLDGGWSATCRGCGMASSSTEWPIWPCQTALLLAVHLGPVPHPDEGVHRPITFVRPDPADGIVHVVDGAEGER